MRKAQRFTIVCSLLLLLGPFAFSADVYITQNASGGDTGANCANAHSASWFNSNATGGNTYHLCGTFTGAANTTMLTVPASGSAGSPLAIYFEPGAVLTSPAWSTNGAILIKGVNYVTVDGGRGGIIQNTDDGSLFTYQQTSYGIVVLNSNNVEIKNLHVLNIYQNDGLNPNNADTGGSLTSGIHVPSGSSSHISIHDNVVTMVAAGIDYAYANTTNDDVKIYNNSISSIAKGIQFTASAGITATVTNAAIYNNTITSWAAYRCPTASSFCSPGLPDPYHKDGILVYKPAGNTVPTQIAIYNNYIYGDMSGGATAAIYCTYGGGTSGYNNLICEVFNNVIAVTPAGSAISINSGTGPSPQLIYNNTIIGNTDNPSILFHNGTGGFSSGIVKNNIVTAGKFYQAAWGTGASLATSIAASDHNNYSGSTRYPANTVFDSSDGKTWAAWQAAGFDVSGTYAVPNTLSDFTLPATSPAVGSGENLSAQCTGSLAPLCYDRAGNYRPVSGTWDAGAYQYAKIVAPPTALTVTVH